MSAERMRADEADAEPKAGAADCGPDCDQALADLERFLDGDLDDAEGVRIRQHLATCYPCTDRATFEEQMRALLRRCCADTAPDGLIERIRTALDTGTLRDA